MNTTESPIKNSVATTVVFSSILCLILLVELIGNILVLAVVRHQRRNLRQRVTNALLANLAFIDLLVPTFLIPFSLAVLIHGRQILTFAVCQLNGFVASLVGSASILTMAVIGIDRYLVIVSPSGRRLHYRKALFLLCGVWLISVIISLLPILFWGSYKATEKSTTCKPESGSFVLLLATVCFVIPFVIMVYCYTKVFIKVQRHKRLLDALKTKSRSIKTEFRTTKIVFIVLTVFVVAWLPFVVVYVVSSNGNDMNIPPMVFQLCGLLAAAHSMCNPIIYLAMNKSFRRDAFGLIPCLKRFVNNTSIGYDSQCQQSSTRNNTTNRSQIHEKLSTTNRKESTNNIEVIALD